MSEVSVLLKMLDQETLSSSVREKKTSVWNLLQQIQPSGGDDRQNVFKNTNIAIKLGGGTMTTQAWGMAMLFYFSVFNFLYFSGTDYIYMNSSVYRNGTSFVESLFEKFGEFICIHDVHLY